MWLNRRIAQLPPTVFRTTMTRGFIYLFILIKTDNKSCELRQLIKPFFYPPLAPPIFRKQGQVDVKYVVELSRNGRLKSSLLKQYWASVFIFLFLFSSILLRPSFCHGARARSKLVLSSAVPPYCAPENVCKTMNDTGVTKNNVSPHV